MQTLFLPTLTREQRYYFLRILAALLEFLSVEAHAAGVQMEILLWRSSLRPWLGCAAYGSFAHHAQPTQAATNIQPSAQLLVHGRGASLRLLACHLFMPLWGGRFLPLSMYRKGVFLILPEAGSQWQFKYFFYSLGPYGLCIYLCFVFHSVPKHHFFHNAESLFWYQEAYIVCIGYIQWNGRTCWHKICFDTGDTACQVKQFCCKYVFNINCFTFWQKLSLNMWC